MSNNIEFLKKRAKEFYELGFEDIEKKRYNLAVLDFEHTLQLYLKYLIGLKAGDYPKTHYLTDLLEKVIDIYNLKELKNYYKNNRLVIKAIEDGYLTSRYFPKEYKYEEALEIKEVALKILKILENGTQNKLI